MKIELPEVLDKLKTAARTANEKVDTAADLIAKKCTEVTGREINGPQLKSAAIRIGGIAMGLGAAMAMASIAAGTVGHSVTAGDGDAGGHGAGGLPTPPGHAGYPSTGDFEGNVGMFFAQHGVAVHEMTPQVTAAGDVSWES